jgi:hypothetical protein
MNSIPQNRREFERNFHLLKEAMMNGEMTFSYEVEKSVENGILKVRYLENGRCNFLTVNESARLLANTAANKESMIKNQQNYDKNT